jgi:hypothetical protein
MEFMERSKSPPELTRECRKIFGNLEALFTELWHRYTAEYGPRFMEHHPPHRRWRRLMERYLSGQVIEGENLTYEEKVARLISQQP